MKLEGLVKGTLPICTMNWTDGYQQAITAYRSNNRTTWSVENEIAIEFTDDESEEHILTIHFNRRSVRIEPVDSNEYDGDKHVPPNEISLNGDSFILLAVVMCYYNME